MSSLMDMIAHHIRPWIFLLTSLTHIPGTLFAPRDAASPSFREAWFLRFWSDIGPSLHEGVSPYVIALLQGRASRGAVTDEARYAALGGTVLEIGAATGLWAKTLAERPGVDRVYGVEPNRASRRVLEGVVEREGLEGRYTIVPAGIEDAGEWVERGSVDCVVTILCMCSIPDPDKIAKEVYEYLKPGGRWYVFEHVRADGVGWWMKFYQGLVNLFWPTLIGGCELRRRTVDTLVKAGEWSQVDLERLTDEPWYRVVPHVYGVLEK